MPVRFGGIYVPYATLFRAGAKRRALKKSPFLRTKTEKGYDL